MPYRPQKITFADMCDMGVRGLLISLGLSLQPPSHHERRSLAGQPGHRYPPDSSGVDMAMDGCILLVERRWRNQAAEMETLGGALPPRQAARKA
jgi:hypothetical protein